MYCAVILNLFPLQTGCKDFTYTKEKLSISSHNANAPIPSTVGEFFE